MVSSVQSRLLLTVLVCLVLAGFPLNTHASITLSFEGVSQTLATGGSTALSSPSGIVVDTAANVFIADTGHSRIVEVNARGTAAVVTITGLSTALSSPQGLAIDGANNLYIADTGNSRVVKVTAGAGSVIPMGSVTLASPQGVAVDQTGDIFIADTGNSRIVEVTSGGAAAALSITVSTAPSTLSSPIGVAVNVSGKLYIADSGAGHNRVVTVAAGSTTGVVQSIADGVVLGTIGGIALDRIGNVFIADTSNNRIAEIDTAGNGGVLLSFSSFTLNAPGAVAVDVFGTVYVADTLANQALMVSPGIEPQIAWGEAGYSLNKSVVGFGHVQLGSATPLSLSLPFTVGETEVGAVEVFTSGKQNLDFTISTDGCTGMSATPCSEVIQFLPTAPGLRTGAVVLYDSATPHNPILTVPLYGWSDAPVAALAPKTATKINTGAVVLNFPFQIALDGAGNIYDANDGGNLVKIPAGGGSASVVSLPGYPFGGEVTGVALDGAGNLFVSDHLNSRILVMTPGGVASALTINGLATPLGLPTELAFDGAGNLYISDYSHGRVVEVSSLSVAGSTSMGMGTVIGTGAYTTSTDGITGVAVDWMGNIYIPDGYQQSADPSRVIKVTASGAVSLLSPTGITFSSPTGATADGMGNIYIADEGHSRVVEITTAGVASVLTFNSLPSPATLSSPFGVTVDPLGNLYIPDSGNGRILFSNVSGGALTFPSTGTGATSAARTATVTNLGDQALVFSTNPTYTANFSNNSGDTNPCTSSTSLLAGTPCDVSVVFTPQSVGSLSAGITVTNNTLNVAGSTQHVSVSGTSYSSGDTTATAVTIAPTSLNNGQTATITATVSDTTTGHTSTIPTGPVTFTDTLGSTTISLNGGSPVSLSAGKAISTGVLLNGIGTHTIAAHYSGVTGSYLASSGSTTVALSKATFTVAGPATQPVAVVTGQAGSVTITVTGPYTTIAAPSGTLSYSILNASNTSAASGTATLTAGSGSSTAAVPVPSSLAAGSYTISVTYSGDGNYLAASTATTILLQIGQLTPTITWSPAASSISYGATLAGILNASASFGSTALPGVFTYTATRSGGSAVSVSSASVLGAGSYVLTAAFAPTSATNYSSVSKTTTITVNQATPAIELTSSLNPVLSTNPTILTATVSSPAGTPTGTVTFLDGTTPLGQGTLSAGVATLTSASLTVGMHTITATSSGDTNFVAVTSSALTESVLDFNLGSSGSGSAPVQTVIPGGAATYPLSIVPSNGVILPALLTLTVSGLPPGATAVLAPSSWTQLTSTSWTYPANIALVATTLTIQLPSSAAGLDRGYPPGQKLPPLLWGMLFLPFAGKLRRCSRRLRRTASMLLLFAAGLAAVSALSGCGSATGLFSQRQQTYTVTITATSGTLSHSTTVLLTVE
jgi:sugar lactone lactonase YvrE